MWPRPETLRSLQADVLPIEAAFEQLSGELFLRFADGAIYRYLGVNAVSLALAVPRALRGGIVHLRGNPQ
jgi:hypothetical protein